MNVLNQVILKMKLEKMFLREINTIFNFMIANFKLSVFRREEFDVWQYRQLWRDILLKHYRRVQKNFLNVDGKKGLEPDIINDETLKLVLETWAINKADRVAEEITKTNLNDVRKAMQQAHEESVEKLDYMDLILASIVILKRRFNGRKTTIITTETNDTSENTKLTEKSIKGEVMIGGVLVSKVTQKIWNHIGDNRVRDAHREAGGQTRMLNEPFNVGGELLQYPSDRSLGASAANVCNCRCTMSFK